MKKYTNKILIVTFAVLALAMVVFITVFIQINQKEIREHPEKYQRVDTTEMDSIDVFQIDSVLVEDSL